ncbi:MAG: transporter permease [Paenibacillaceae bacterium]|jgi:ABC-2 type transport system permease protein|nr:transporter permease [Paenibacillaceae bacterium]
MFYISLGWDYLKNYMKIRLSYRADLLVEILSDLLFQGVNLFFLLVVFMHTDLLDGWTESQMLFVYGYFMVPYGIFTCCFNLWNFTDRYIVKGEMDRILTRPAYNLVQLILENLDPPSLAGSIVGLVIMASTWPSLGAGFDWYDPFVVVLLVAGSVAVYAGIYVTFTAISFFTDAPTGILPLIFNIQNYGRYPVTIYNKTITVLLTGVLPFAFVGFYPAAYFLNRAEWGKMAMLTPVVGAVFLAGALLFWNFGVSRYRGAGS